MFVFLPFRADDDEYSFERKPWLTWSILALCIAIYTAMTYGLSEQQIEHLYYEFGCVPSEFHWWTMFTCTLLHGSVGHLLGNMFFFFIYAPMCEKAFGHGRFLLLYLLGAAASMEATDSRRFSPPDKVYGLALAKRVRFICSSMRSAV